MKNLLLRLKKEHLQNLKKQSTVYPSTFKATMIALESKSSWSNLTLLDCDNVCISILQVPFININQVVNLFKDLEAPSN